MRGFPIVGVLAFCACGHEDSSGDGGDSDVDVDTDVDTDTDTDSDGDCDDADLDGFMAAACGGDDCDDADEAAHPGAPDNAGFAWRLETLDPGSRPSLALDAAGVVHVVFDSADGLRYATNPTGLWRVETVDADGGGVPAVGVSPDGAVHVGYVAAPDELRHATTAGDAWTVDVVETGVVVPRDLGIAIGADGVVHLAWLFWGGGAYEVDYASDEGGTFVTEPVGDAQERSGVAIAVDAAGAAHVVWQMPDFALTHAAREGIGWGRETVEAGGTPGTLVAGAGDELRIAFVGADGIRYGERTAGEWTIETADPLGGFDPGLAIEAGGVVHLAFMAIRDGLGLQVGTNRGGAWTFEGIEDSEAGTPIAVDDAGNLHVAHSGGGRVRHARRLAPDGVDQDCDGVDGIDLDGDGFASSATGGGDCDDERAAVHPGADDPAGDGVDQDCDGVGGTE